MGLMKGQKIETLNRKKSNVKLLYKREWNARCSRFYIQRKGSNPSMNYLRMSLIEEVPVGPSHRVRIQLFFLRKISMYLAFFASVTLLKLQY